MVDWDTDSELEKSLARLFSLTIAAVFMTGFFILVELGSAPGILATGFGVVAFFSLNYAIKSDGYVRAFWKRVGGIVP